jgi:non-ribosomal peptide synthetase component E (peptide arylation enzyme)
MATLSTSFPSKSDEIAVIVPGENPLSVSFTQLNAEIRSFQQKLAKLGIGHGAAVSIALANSYEFIVRPALVFVDVQI